MQLLVAHFEKGFVLRVQRAGVMFSYGHRPLAAFCLPLASSFLIWFKYLRLHLKQRIVVLVFPYLVAVLDTKECPVAHIPSIPSGLTLRKLFDCNR